MSTQNVVKLNSAVHESPRSPIKEHSWKNTAVVTTDSYNCIGCLKCKI